MVQINFWNKCDFEQRLYQTGWKQRIFLDADLTTPEYEIVREGKEDINKDFQSESNQWQKSVKLITLCNEVNLESLYFMALHSNIELIYNGVTYEVISCNINAEYESECYARTEITFYIESLFSGCCFDFNTDQIYTAVDDIIKIRVVGNGSTNSIILTLTSDVLADMSVNWGDGNTTTVVNTLTNNFSKTYPAGVSGTYEITAWIYATGTLNYATVELTDCIVNTSLFANTLILANFIMPTNCPKLENYQAITDQIIQFQTLELNDSMTALETVYFYPAITGGSNIRTLNEYQNTNIKNLTIRYAQLVDISDILVFINSKGHAGGTIDLSGGTSAGYATLSAAGQAAYADLISRGYTMILN